AELHRVHEDAGDEALAVPARRVDEAHVPGVQIPHGGHEGHAPAFAAPAAHARVHGGNRGDGLHALKAVFGGGVFAALHGAHVVLQRLEVVVRALHEIPHEARLASGRDVEDVVGDQDLAVGVGAGA